MSKGGRCDLDKEIATDGTYRAYFPFGAMIERAQMAPFHGKFVVKSREMWYIAKEDPLGIAQPQFVVKSREMWYIAKEDPLGIVLVVQPEGSYFWDVPQIAAFHNKLLEDTKLLTHLNKSLNTTIKLLGGVTCRYLNADTCLTLRNYWVVEASYKYTLLLELGSEVL